MERAIVRKKGWIIVTSLVVIVVIAVIGGKMYMDNRETKKIGQERKFAIQVKNMFRDVKKVRIQNVDYNLSTGFTDSDVIVYKKDGSKYSANITLGEYDGVIGDKAGYELGKTSSPVEAIYSNDKTEVIK